jgi:hypothetical protein
MEEAPLRTIRTNVLMLCLISTPLAWGVVVANDVPPPDQVIVQGKRGDLVKAAKDVQLLEQRFFQRYNELNTKKNYAVRCYNEAATGTRFKQKYCKPVYETNAEAAEAREFITAIGRGASAGSTSGGASASSGVMAAGGASGGQTGAGGPNLSSGGDFANGVGNGAVSAGAQIAGTAPVALPVAGGGTVAAFVEKDTTRPDFQNNVRDVVSKNPELVKLLQEHDAARQRYEALYREMNGPREAKADTPTTSKSEEAR